MIQQMSLQLTFCFAKIQNGLLLWCRFIQVVLENDPILDEYCFAVSCLSRPYIYTRQGTSYIQFIKK